ncbi:MAG TPA: class I SAM-dependent methyltransferase [Anaerolineales bacterium]
MPNFTDQEYLKNDQYHDSSNLDARMNLHQRFSTNPQGWFPWVFDTLDQLPRQARVLELGSGPGSLWSTCVERIPVGWVITLSDISEGMLLSAWRNLVVTGRAFKFQQFDAQSIPYPEESFEVVIANHMLYHVPDRPQALREIHWVLKTGGHLVAATNGINHLKELIAWLKQVSPEGASTPPSSLFSLESGLPLLQAIFRDVEVRRYQNSLRITQIEPIMAYIQSMLRAADYSEADLARLRGLLEIELQSKEALNVATNTGLFLAVKH